MAFVKFDGATKPVDMIDRDLVQFGTNDGAFASAWSWRTPDGHDIDMGGRDLTYDQSQRALTGRINLIQIDVDNDSGLGNPDMKIEGLNTAAAVLDDSPEAFWNAVLGGNDIIQATALSADRIGLNISRIFGDDLKSQVGAAGTGFTDQGGNDVITLGLGSVVAIGDVFEIAGSAGLVAAYRAGNDQLLVGTSDVKQQLIGDAFVVRVGCTLNAGDDLIQFGSTNLDSVVIGDLDNLQGVAFTPGIRTVLHGGDDRLEARSQSESAIVGDLRFADGFVEVFGGDDRIQDGDRGNIIIGDVDQDAGFGVATIVGGDDEIFGGGGDDRIIGDLNLADDETDLAGGDDVIHGGDGADEIFGEVRTPGGANVRGGRDLLFGDEGDDRLFGQAASDRLEGGAGADLLDGGVATDLASYFGAATGVVADLQKAAQNTGDAAGDVYVSIEGLLGSSFADTLRGDDAANQLIGSRGGDILIGRDGADQLHGGDGADVLHGGVGDDTLRGGNGTDALVGGLGKDRLEGGAGRDRFDFNAVAESPTGSGRDVIVDFTAGQDTIDLAGIDANVAADGDQAFAFIGAAGFSRKAGELRYDGKTLQGDVNGDGVADLQIELTAVPSLAAADLLL